MSSERNPGNQNRFTGNLQNQVRSRSSFNRNNSIGNFNDRRNASTNNRNRNYPENNNGVVNQQIEDSTNQHHNRGDIQALDPSASVFQPTHQLAAEQNVGNYQRNMIEPLNLRPLT